MLRFLRRKPHTQVVIDLWNSPRSRAMDYYVKAEAAAWINCFWDTGSLFRKHFDRLDLTSVLDHVRRQEVDRLQQLQRGIRPA